MRTKSTSVNCKEFLAKIEKLQAINSATPNIGIVSILKDILPEYRSNNAAYGALDTDQ